MTDKNTAGSESASQNVVGNRSYRYYDLIMALFVTCLLCSNIIGTQKVANLHNLPILGDVTFGAAILFFPISYMFGDVLTEVYGYARSRRVVWAGFGALIFASLMSAVVVALPSDNLEQQAVVAKVFGSTWRIAMASLVGYFCGEFTNSFILAKMKILTQGKHLWTRTIGSTVAGELVDSLVFYPLAFYGLWDNDTLLTVMFSNYVIKVMWEVVVTPITYKLVAFLKRVEQEDYYDHKTQFTPFSIDA